MFSKKIHDYLGSKNGKAIAVFIDFKKALGRNRKILIKKLMDKYDLALFMVKILSYYFSGRKFKIVMEDKESKYYKIENGVPPGAGP